MSNYLTHEKLVCTTYIGLGSFSVGIFGATSTAIGASITNNNVGDEASTWAVGGLLTGGALGLVLALTALCVETKDRLNNFFRNVFEFALTCVACSYTQDTGEYLLDKDTDKKQVVSDTFYGLLIMMAAGLCCIGCILPSLVFCLNKCLLDDESQNMQTPRNGGREIELRRPRGASLDRTIP
jgi:hypothetical protein